MNIVKSKLELADSGILNSQKAKTQRAVTTKDKIAFYDALIENINQGNGGYLGIDNTGKALIKKIGSKSNNLIVVKTYGYEEPGVVPQGLYAPRSRKAMGAKTVREKARYTSAVIGYKIRNVGNEVIRYGTEVFSRDNETGEVRSNQQIEYRELHPGEEVILTRKFLGLLALMPEYNLTLGNGHLSIKKYTAGTVDQHLENMYFTYAKEPNALVSRSVHTTKEDIYTPVIDRGFERNRVKDEFISVFGGYERLSKARIDKKIYNNEKPQTYTEKRQSELDSLSEAVEQVGTDLANGKSPTKTTDLMEASKFVVNTLAMNTKHSFLG